ncbi:MAG: tRNA dihydrouridine(20/20a) synthase DusA [Burkholderiales bacterium]|jgi:tRNA-dihydrouridine synthase A|nr:tRNA dihydrouridine(20/20a) synthase DusA [Burkholderiales bacterium]
MTEKPSSVAPYRFCVAPMLDWTDRHCRYFHRLLSPHVRLYTEMVTAPALYYGDATKHLDFDAAEHPLALQLGGSDPAMLAHAARLGARWGYDEINLNCGCPSERVQSGSFGACLMKEPALVADCVRAMREAVSIPVTVKHRIGVDAIEDYGFVRDFVGAVHEAGCEVFIVHARNAILSGLSPKDNREIPPLRYETVHRLKRDFPQCTIVLNGGLTDWPTIEAQLATGIDGVMVGRWAYHQPYCLAEAEARLFGRDAPLPTRRALIEAMIPYVKDRLREGIALCAITRHILGLYHGQPRARLFRQWLSEPRQLERQSVDVLYEALAWLEGGRVMKESS